MPTAQQPETKNQIIELEKKLLDAFQNKNLEVLDELIHPNATFVLPNAVTANKTMVLNNYRSGNSAFTNITASNQAINLINNTAVVSVTLTMQGNYYDKAISAQFQYIRVWQFTNNTWQVIAVSGVPINK